MRTHALVIVAAGLMFGCNRPVKPEFDKAVVERPLVKDGKIVFDKDGKAKMEVRTITGRAEIEKLASFFPEMGQGKESSVAGAWKTAYTVKFERDKGELLTVRTDYKFQQWSEGRGDWEAQSGLKDFMDDLFKKDGTKANGGDGPNEGADAGWSKPVNGLQGRLVRHPKPKVNSTEIVEITLELKSVSTEPLAVQNDPAAVKVELFDSNGKPVADIVLRRSGPVPQAQWGVLPCNTYLGFSLFDSGVGVPQGKGALLSLLPPSTDWLLKPSKYTVRGTFTVGKTTTMPKDAWTGQLDLPSLTIEVR